MKKFRKLKFRVAGKEKKLSLGAYPSVKLADARTGRDEARAQLSTGGASAHERKMEKTAAMLGVSRRGNSR